MHGGRKYAHCSAAVHPIEKKLIQVSTVLWSWQTTIEPSLVAWAVECGSFFATFQLRLHIKMSRASPIKKSIISGNNFYLSRVSNISHRCDVIRAWGGAPQNSRGEYYLVKENVLHLIIQSKYNPKNQHPEGINLGQCNTWWGPVSLVVRDWHLRDSVVLSVLAHRPLLHIRDGLHVAKMQASAIDKSTISAKDFCRTRDLLSDGSGTGESVEVTADDRWKLFFKWQTHLSY